VKATVISCEVFVPSPREGVATHGSSYYTSLDSDRLMSIHGHESRSDTCDASFMRLSDDNGRTWSESTELPASFEHPGGTGRRHNGGGYVDPATGRYVTIRAEGVLPTDDPLEGMRQWKLHYTVSEDGGLTRVVDEQIVHEGDEFDEVHHLPGVSVGKNCAMMGDLGQRPLTRSDGAILVPVQSSPAGPDGHYANPGAGYTYTDCMLLIGRWSDDCRIRWTASERIVGDPDRSTRGMIEPTIAELADGSLIMVMRGSNDARPDLPGNRWLARSSDGGMTWTTPEPWTFTDGTAFFSPSSTSQLIPWSDGRLFWMGNMCDENPSGNSPRYPIVLGEVGRDTGLFLRDTVTTIDDRKPDESPHLTLSNFYGRQDRETGDLLLHMTRLFARDFRRDGAIDWTADAMLYRIGVE